MGQQNVLIAVPTSRDEVHVNFAFSLVDTTRALSEAGAQYRLMHVGSSHITRARNLFANYFMDHGQFTHLLFLDADMHFPAHAIMKLLIANRSVAGVAYPYRRVDLNRRIAPADSGLSMRDWLEKHADYTVQVKSNQDGSAQVVDGFVEAEHIGTGILLVQRDAFEAARPFATRFGPPEQYRSVLPSGNFYGFFDSIEEHGAYLSEDLSFCRRARLGGCAIWALVDQTVVHYGASEVAGQYLRALTLRGNVG
ncbi:hypothetical protein [Paraburkholderia monticola]|uniref:hypothetical protein n=1 Tax=Paraburkholderia monticola TaxID=1399968 RepID=UPI0009500A4A|nr:hypothetical protein [Paraburkholderia monticola]